jgi:hypothetical protein
MSIRPSGSQRTIARSRRASRATAPDSRCTVIARTAATFSAPCGHAMSPHMPMTTCFRASRYFPPNEGVEEALDAFVLKGGRSSQMAGSLNDALGLCSRLPPPLCPTPPSATADWKSEENLQLKDCVVRSRQTAAYVGPLPKRRTIDCVDNHRGHIGKCRCSQRELESVPLIQGRCNYTCEQRESRKKRACDTPLTF